MDRSLEPEPIALPPSWHHYIVASGVCVEISHWGYADEFLDDATNVVLVGPNGVGKSMLAQNIAHQALIEGHTVLFASAGQLLGDLAALDSDAALRRRLRHYVRPQLLNRLRA